MDINSMIPETVTIKKLVHGGAGLAFHQGRTWFVEGVLPGEKVIAMPYFCKRKMVFADACEITEASPHRVNPVCNVNECGGCDWQHIDINAQREYKREIFLECMKRIGGFEFLPHIYFSHSPNLAYRLRMRLQIDAAEGRAGYFGKRSHRVVHLPYCPVLQHGLENLISENIFKLLPGPANELRAIEGTDGLVASSPVLPGRTKEATHIKIPLSGDSKDIQLKVRGGSFFQANRFILHSMPEWITPFIDEDFCIDLYGGAGYFSCALASGFKGGLLVEELKDQASLAEENFAAHGFTHFRAAAIRAEEITGRDIPVKGSRLCVVVDPPRTGLSPAAIKALLHLEPRRIVSISCDPATHARDVKIITEQGYAIRAAAIFDMAPQTHHVESGIILEKT